MSKWWSSDSMDHAEEAAVDSTSPAVAPVPTPIPVYPPSHYPLIRSAHVHSKSSSSLGTTLPSTVPSASSFHHKTATSPFSPVAQRALHVETAHAVSLFCNVIVIHL